MFDHGLTTTVRQSERNHKISLREHENSNVHALVLNFKARKLRQAANMSETVNDKEYLRPCSSSDSLSWETVDCFLRSQ